MTEKFSMTSIDDDKELAKAYDFFSCENYLNSLQFFEDLASKGNAEAEYCVAFHYLNGRGVTRDPLKAFGILKSASEKGYVPAKTDLAQCYAYGVGTRTDDETAFKLFLESAGSGDPYAMSMVSLMYYNGEGVKRDKKQAEKWQDSADSYEDAEETESAGLQYAVKGNYILARILLMRSAMAGSAISAKALELMSHFGLGVTDDSAEASDWRETADDLGWDEVESGDLEPEELRWFERFINIPRSEY